MQIRKGLLLAVLLCVLGTAFAQNDEDGAAQKRERLNAILADTLAEIQDLRLPENRAVFYARIGDLIWLQDEKRARALFRNATAELVAAQNFAESNRGANPYNELLQGSSTRQQILNSIANRDAELALELLVSTRPVNILRALQAPDDKSHKISNFRQNNAYLAQNERYMEQNFYRLAADQTPERAVRLLKESLSKGLTNETFNQLERLAQKDEAAAAEIGSQVVDKLLRSNYLLEEQPNYVDIQLTNAILNYQISRRGDDSRKLKFDDAQIQSLGSKFINGFLSDQRIAGAIGQGIVQVAERIRPSSVEQLKKAYARMYPQNGGSELDTAYQKLVSGDTAAEDMLAAADRFPMSTRRQIYQTASNRLMGQGNWQAAREVISENFASDDTEQTLANFDQQLVYNLIGQGKYSEAEALIDGMPEQYKVPLLANLSSSAFNRNQPGDRAHANTLLGKARQLISEKPENSSEFGMFTHVVHGYCSVDPGEAMRLFENVIPKLIELMNAAAVLNGFQMNSNVREGEFLVTQGSPLDQFGGNTNLFSSFARFDLERTLNLIGLFKRPEIVVSLKLQILEGSELTSAPVTGSQIVAMPTVRRRHE
jgi:hypothetical protein